MKLLLLAVGRKRRSWADEPVDDYLRRVRRFCPAGERFVKPAPFRGREHEVRRAEGERVQRLLKPGDRVVVLDERGQTPTTDAFRRDVERSMNRGVSRLVFCMGGAYGHDPSLRSRADRVMALSSLVLNHRVARVVFWEQIYRVLSLVRGHPYHH